MEKKKVTVLVAGQRFNILTEKEEKYVIDIASKIDARITSLSISGNMTRERAAVLTALDFADDNEIDKENLEAVKQQIKDYVSEIERLSGENAALKAQLEEQKSLSDHLKQEKKALLEQADTLQKHIESFRISADSIAAKKQDAAPAPVEEKPTEEPKPADEPTPAAVQEPAEEKPKEQEITAEDDLFFNLPEEPVVKPPKNKKPRHEHQHVNPYRQQHMAKKEEQKGYTQQRQYSLFDTDE